MTKFKTRSRDAQLFSQRNAVKKLVDLNKKTDIFHSNQVTFRKQTQVTQEITELR
jgi:hypothetical protein